jgi:hypothetical protein
MIPNEFGALFDPLYQAHFINLAELPIESRPSQMAHYTSISALENIVRSKELWFSNPLIMNDREEMSFGIFHATRILREASAGSILTDLVGGVENFTKITQNYDNFMKIFNENVALDVYVFCVSEYDAKKHPDGRLSMWRGYGANGNGVALVFNTSFISVVQGSPLLMAKVRYGDADERIEWIRESFTACLEVLSRNALTPQNMWITAWHLFRFALYHSLSAKHPGFREEDEWRIVYFPDHDNDGLMKNRRDYFCSRRCS